MTAIELTASRILPYFCDLLKDRLPDATLNFPLLSGKLIEDYFQYEDVRSYVNEVAAFLAQTADAFNPHSLLLPQGTILCYVLNAFEDGSMEIAFKTALFDDAPWDDSHFFIAHLDETRRLDCLCYCCDWLCPVDLSNEPEDLTDIA